MAGLCEHGKERYDHIYGGSWETNSLSVSEDYLKRVDMAEGIAMLWQNIRLPVSQLRDYSH
jgi:hypothetical protein